MIAIDTRDFCIPSDENDYDELVAFADTITGIQTHEVIPIDVLDKIKGYIDHIRNTGMGKNKSLEFIEKFIEGLKAESEDK